MKPHARIAAAALSALALSAFGHASAQLDPAAAEPRLDAIFGRAFTGETPGCAVAVRDHGSTIQRAYGLADMEHAVRNTPETIFESGSVAKQFTAMAVLLLEQDGKLKTTDDIRTYLPEMPAYEAPITIDMLLNHTSGLRDWGSIAAASGLPRGERNFTNADVLDMMKRQRALNYRPGAEYSYTNSGYNLLAIIVERVSGKTLQQFTDERMFRPLGMTHTRWREDFNTLVRGRAVAYARSGQAYEQSMPFMNVTGNGGLLTTVGDLLIWNDALTTSKLGPEVTAGMTRRGVLTSGRQIVYARGLEVSTYRGFNEISHSGGTGGYTTWLVRYPDQDVSLAILCNTPPTTFNPRQVGDIFLPPPAPGAARTPPVAAIGLPDPAPYAGVYAQTVTGTPSTVTVTDGQLRWGQAQGFVRVGEARWEDAQGGSLTFSGTDTMTGQPPNGGEPMTFRRAQPAQTSAADLAAYAGAYASEEAGAAYSVAVENGQLVLSIDRRPNATARLTPAYRDAFIASNGRLVRFRRNSAGGITAMSLADGRMRDLNIPRVAAR